MKSLICPVCALPLNREERTFKCDKNHCFDLSKYGVLNLALSNKSKDKRHGDDKAMVVARRKFLENGYYENIRKTVSYLAEKHGKKGVFLDAGCGEGYYTSAVAERTNPAEIYGIDISKEAVRYFKKRLPNSVAVVASIYKIPIKTNSVDILLSLFAPKSETEFSRLLSDNGILIRTTVLKEHLFELKQAVYDIPYENDCEETDLNGFEIIEEVTDDYFIEIKSNADIKALFLMTPYYYKTGAKDQAKLENLQKLKVKVQVKTTAYKKAKKSEQ